MTRAWWLLVTLFLAGCTTQARTTTEYDSASQQIANYWTSVFWVTLLICATVCVVAVSIGVTMVERAKSRAEQAQYEARYREARRE